MKQTNKLTKPNFTTASFLSCKRSFIKILILSCLIWHSINDVMAQTGNPYWALPPNYTTFPVTPIPLPTNSYLIGGSNTAYQGTEMYDYVGYDPINSPSNMYTDANGNPLFSIVGGFMFNRNGFLIDSLIDTLTVKDATTGLTNSNYRMLANGHTEICVVPNPGNCQQYYVFTSATTGEAMYSSDTYYGYYRPSTCGIILPTGGSPNTYIYNMPYYTLIDLSQTGPYMPASEYGKNLKPSALGNATMANLYKATSTQGGTSGCAPFVGDIHYAATTLINKSGVPYRLLFLVNNAEIITYKISSTGLQWLHSYDLETISSNRVGGYNIFSNVSELEIYQDYSTNRIKVAFSTPNAGSTYSSSNSLTVMDFDTTGAYYSANGVRATYNIANTFYIKGIEFSPNGKYIYVAHSKVTGSTPIVERFLYSNLATVSTISTDSTFQFTQIEMAKDTALYLLQYNSPTNSKLAKITNPSANSPSLSTGLTTLAYPLEAAGSCPLGDSYYPLPDQIDHDIYGSQFNNNTTCCLFYGPYSQTYYQAGQSTPTGWTANSQTWTPHSNPLNGGTGATATIGEMLRIPASYTITIDSMMLKFSPQAHLIVENGTSSKNGGKLILNTCTLTADNRCETDMWPGIQVWGSPAYSQTGVAQGWLSLTNNTVIENAYIGVLAGCDTTSWLSTITPAPALPLNSQAGHLSFGPGNYGGGAIIQSTSATFLNNQRHLVYNDYSTSASSFQKLQTTTFKSTKLIASSVHQRYFVGMYYHPSSVIMSGCVFTDTTLNNFSDTALYSINSAYYIDEYSSTQRSIFTNFLYGIHSNNVGSTATITCKNSTFTSNKVGIYLGNITNATISTDTFKIYGAVGGGNCSGLYLDNCTGYKVEGNNFTKNGSTSNHKYGILVYNSGAYVNCIYNNTFDNIYKGSQAQYRNYINNFTGGAAHNSGGGLVYLCNVFSLTSASGGFADIYVPGTGQAANVGGTYTGTDTAGIGYNQGTGSTYPISGGNQFSHIGSGAYDFYIDTTSAKAWRSVYEYCTTCGTLYDPLKVHNVAVNGISSNVNCSTDPYSNGLRSADPYSNMINGAAIYKLTYDSITNVMSSLPDTSVIKKANLSVYRGDILSARHRLIDNAIHYLLGNGSDTSLSRIRILMREKALELSSRSKLETALFIQDSALAATALAEVINQEGQNNYVAIHTILLQNLSKTPSQIMQNQNTIRQLQAIAADNSDHTAYLKAHLLLSTIGLSNYQLYYQENNSDFPSDDQKVMTLEPAKSLSTLQNSPNPFKESTIIKAVVVEKTDNAYVVITDMLGNEVERYQVNQGENNITINAGNLSQSVTFCTLIIDGKRIKTNKMVFVK